VYESEAGHIREMDDTAGAERIHERHASGSGYEIHPDGSKVTRVKNDNYTLVTNDDFVHIKGNSSTTVDGGVRVFVNADGSTDDQNYTIEVGNNANVNIQVNKGDVNVVTAEGDINLKSANNINMQTNGFRLQAQTVDISVSGQWTETTKDKTEVTTLHYMEAKSQTIIGNSEVDIDGGRIDLN
jgi:dipeptidyl aminopeptidase/acylaminoacyl peptidase